jgi:hypothetical protein
MTNLSHVACVTINRLSVFFDRLGFVQQGIEHTRQNADGLRLLRQSVDSGRMAWTASRATMSSHSIRLRPLMSRMAAATSVRPTSSTGLKLISSGNSEPPRRCPKSSSEELMARTRTLLEKWPR